MTIPCKDCPDKGCGSRHDTCESYQAWRRENDKVKARRAADAEKNNFFMERRMKNKIDRFRKDEK